MNYALIFAGGTGQRMRSKEIPKQLLKVHDKEIIIHTLNHFEKHAEIESIVLVFNENYIEEARKIIKEFKISKVKDIVPGGETGQDSIYNGLKVISKFAKEDDIVLIHDGVRPLIDDDLITSNITNVKIYGSSISATPAIETILMTNESNEVIEIVDRTKARYGRAPQSFYFSQIYDAHNKAIKDGKHNFVDSASLMKHYGHTLSYVDCSIDNIKITTIKDYYIFKAILDAKEMGQFSLDEVKNEG